MKADIMLRGKRTPSSLIHLCFARWVISLIVHLRIIAEHSWWQVLFRLLEKYLLMVGYFQKQKEINLNLTKFIKLLVPWMLYFILALLIGYLCLIIVKFHVWHKKIVFKLCILTWYPDKNGSGSEKSGMFFFYQFSTSCYPSLHFCLCQ